ncbi:hypothetical protein [Solibacillus sp. FSL H8-0538]|uniref:hypothetical protein n=1 Tax=Solibacillus sp. FSL H8-0538 TaxID=2921400 RepID=UPI0030F7A11D
MILVFLILAACSNEEQQTVESKSASIKEIANSTRSISQLFESPDIASEYDLAFSMQNTMQLYFKEDQSIAYFEGIGNEFASYTEKTSWLSNEYVRIEYDNGAVLVVQYFRVTDKGIFQLTESVEETEYSIAELDTLQPISTLLEAPLQQGAQFGNWTIVSTNEVKETPYDTFTKVIVLMSEKDGITEMKYFAPGYGIISTISSMETEDDQPYIVQSMLSEMIFE